MIIINFKTNVLSDFLADKLADLNPTMSFESFAAPQLLQYYILLLQTDRYKEAGEFGNRLLEVCRSINCSPISAQIYAFELTNRNKTLEALFFNILSVHLCFYRREIDKIYLDVMTKALEEISKIVEEVIQQAKLSLHVVHRHIIPTLLLANERVIFTFKNKPSTEFAEGFAKANANQSFLICRCQLAAQDFIGCERILKEAIRIYEVCFPKDKTQNRVYGICLHYLGFSFLSRNRLKKAMDYFNEAKVAFGNAKDYKTGEKRKLQDLNEHYIAKVQKIMKQL